MFLSNMSESVKSEVSIHGLDACALEAFIGYAYTGLVQITPRNVQSILIGANFLQLNTVRNICCRYISERLTIDTVLPIRSLAQSFLCTDLVSSCETYIYENFEAVARTSSFFHLDGTELMELLESDELHVSSEERLFHIVMSWVEFEEKPNFNPETNSIVSESVSSTELSDSYAIDPNIRKTWDSNDVGLRGSCSGGFVPSLHHTSDPYSSQINNDKPCRPRTDYLPCLIRRIRLPIIPVNFIFAVISRHDLIRQDIRCRDILDEVRDMLFMPGQASKFFNCRPRRCQDIFGMIYAVGGLTADLECHGVVETYHPSLGRWELSESMISKRSRIGVVALNGLLYAIGGFDGTSRLNTTEVYNPKTKVWKTVAPMICRRSAAGAAAYDGRLYVCGGYNGQTSLRTCEMYTPEQDTWQLIPSMNEPRSAGGLVALNGRLYAIGGHNGLAVFSTVECYDKREGVLVKRPTSSRYETTSHTSTIQQNNTSGWYSVASMLHRRCRHGAAAIRDRIIVAGGYDGASFLQSVEMFDPTVGPDCNGLLGQWTEITSLSVPRSRVGLAVTAGCLYAIGGYDGTTQLRTVECFKPVDQNDYEQLSNETCRLKHDTPFNLLCKRATSSIVAGGNGCCSTGGDVTPEIPKFLYNSDNLSCSNNSDIESISSLNSTEGYTFGDTRNQVPIVLEKPKRRANNPKVSVSSGTAAGGGGMTSTSSTSSSNPFADWQWSFAPPLIAHEGWVGICVLPLDQSPQTTTESDCNLYDIRKY
ncbi:unnamed protein product [Heterobilharzia americana]|nr:unnamed protein product [Heterobilharzia americana]